MGAVETSPEVAWEGQAHAPHLDLPLLRDESPAGVLTETTRCAPGPRTLPCRSANS